MNPPDPKFVRLTEDFLDLDAGVGFPAGSILWRVSTGQYALPFACLGDDCVSAFDRIRDICEVSVPPEWLRALAVK